MVTLDVIVIAPAGGILEIGLLILFGVTKQGIKKMVLFKTPSSYIGG
jgi:hypothetical protein